VSTTNEMTYDFAHLILSLGQEGCPRRKSRAPSPKPRKGKQVQFNSETWLEMEIPLPAIVRKEIAKSEISGVRVSHANTGYGHLVSIHCATASISAAALVLPTAMKPCGSTA
jgi:hypothetical protein